ncbi:MAG TPA: flagellar FlbD family protein [Gaiellales bacterium]|jgi:flagellar protein FlbD|nr:flagellar FlbD family protein [Gaiellales bacterium]
MIPLHRLTHPGLPLYLNPDLIQTIEATPDTVVALTNSSRFVVSETPLEVLTMIRDWRAGIIAQALEHSNGAVPEDLGQVVHLSGYRDPAAHDS